MRPGRALMLAMLLTFGASASIGGCVLDYETLRPDGGIDVANDGRMHVDGSDTANSSCGVPGGPCCEGQRCAPALACFEGHCAPCGGDGMACCAGLCGSGLVCRNDSTCGCGRLREPCCRSGCTEGACVRGECILCGGADERCCSGMCNAGFACEPVSGRCRCGSAGQPCCADAGCVAPATCQIMDGGVAACAN